MAQTSLSTRELRLYRIHHRSASIMGLVDALSQCKVISEISSEDLEFQ